MRCPTDTVRVAFDEQGDFASLRAAESALKRHGFSVGTLQRGAPIAVYYGDAFISKWRNLSDHERWSAHGLLTTASGSFRSGPVHLHENRAMPPEARAAFDALVKEVSS